MRRWYVERGARFCSIDCWIRFRLRHAPRTLDGLLNCLPSQARQKAKGKLYGPYEAERKAAVSGTPRGRPRGGSNDPAIREQYDASAARVAELRAAHPTWGRETLARESGLTLKQVRRILETLARV